jgi:hypothetical protein
MSLFQSDMLSTDAGSLQSIERWQIWNLLPLDPSAWFVLYSEHQAALAVLIESQRRHRLPLEDMPETSSQVLTVLGAMQLVGYGLLVMGCV